MKWELTNSKKEYKGISVYQIRALIDIPELGVRTGDLGCWIRNKNCLTEDSFIKGGCILSEIPFDLLRYDINVGNDVNIGDNVIIGNCVIIGDYVDICNDVDIGNDVKIGDDTSIGNCAKIGNGVDICNCAKIGNNVKIGDYVNIGYSVEIGNSVDISYNVEIIDDVKISNDIIIPHLTKIQHSIAVNSNTLLTFFNKGSDSRTLTAYKYNNEIIVTTGCFAGTLEEFIIAVEKKHGNNIFAKEYMKCAKVIKLYYNL